MSRKRADRLLDFADGVDMPLAASADTHVGYGVKGWGKTWLGMKFAECVLDAGGQVIAIDITGVWWGLTSSADGKRAGYPLYVFGGNKADLPLVPESGELLARTLVESRASAVLDLSLARKGHQQRFAADFLEALYDVKAQGPHRDYVCTVILDEGNRFAPQQPGAEQTRVLGAAEDIILQGRSRGLGMLVLTQRPAVLNKNISTQAGGLFLGRIVSPQDQKAVGDWLAIHATPEASARIMGKPLATMPQGEAIYISTSSGADPARIKLRARKTFDSSYTPSPGQKARVARVRSKLDVEALSAEIKGLAQRVEADKPSALRARILTLEKQLAAAQAKPAAQGKPGKRVEVPALDKRTAAKLDDVRGMLKARREGNDKLVEALAELENLRWAIATDQKHLDTFGELLNASLARIEAAREIKPAAAWADSKTATPIADLRAMREAHSKSTGATSAALDKYSGTHRGVIKAPPHALHEANGDDGNGMPITRPMRAFLTALAQRGTLTKGELLFFGKYRSTGATSRAFANLVKLGYATAPEPNSLEITRAGRDALGSVEPLKSGKELRDELLDDRAGKLPAPVRAFLRVLVEAYPAAVSKKDLLAQGGYKSTGATSRAFSYLRKVGYAESPRANYLAAADTMFDPHERRAAEYQR